ncbi:MAG: hypothetical protein JSW11_00625 [Candidatus Heimdallarchaeota archaeon]|nr:MAG: hypothetical protein JSW11_00625 [Candidatus Heimdallarchaeota archaeon]
MEIEYQNKYVVTWCLDRKGSRICLQATTTENKLRKIGIISEGFNLELDDAEAIDFLNIISQIAASTQFVPHKVVPIEQESPPEVKEEISPEFIPPLEEPTIPEVIPKVEEPIAPEVPDSSEIIQILKESERTYAEITPSSPDDVSVEVPPEVVETTPISYETEEEIVKEIPETESLPSQEESEVTRQEIETASFFQQSVSKSPLEMLLEEDEGEKEEEDVSDVPSISHPEVEDYTPPIESKKTYSPDDLETEAFFSKFDTKRTIDLLQRPEPEPKLEPEPEPEPEAKPEYKRAVQLEPTPQFVKREPVKTEAERRAEIEKERAERRRRLWELTRGF